MSIYQLRLNNLRQKLRDFKLDAFFISNQSNIFYLSGIPPMPDGRELTGLVTTNDIYIFVRSTYYAFAQTKKKYGQILEISLTTKFINLFTEIIKQEKLKTIGFEAADLTVSSLNSLKTKTYKIGGVSFKPTENLVESQRQIKGSQEIALIEKAASITDAAFHFILDKIKPGITEKDVALEIEYFLKKQADSIAFFPIVASGLNAANPHYISKNKKIRNGEMVLLDFGAKVGGYCSDITRTVFMGKATLKFCHIYHAVLEAQEKTLQYMQATTHRVSGRPKRSGGRDSPEVDKGTQRTTIPTKTIDAIARNYIREKGFPNIPHGLGHCLGLDIHELPRLAPNDEKTLKPGMVFTIEPGIYLPGWGGVRIEDLVVWQPKGGIISHSQSSKELLEL